jgi:hypothetical protein
MAPILISGKKCLFERRIATIITDDGLLEVKLKFFEGLDEKAAPLFKYIIAPISELSPLLLLFKVKTDKLEVKQVKRKTQTQEDVKRIIKEAKEK